MFKSSGFTRSLPQKPKTASRVFNHLKGEPHFTIKAPLLIRLFPLFFASQELSHQQALRASFPT